MVLFPSASVRFFCQGMLPYGVRAAARTTPQITKLKSPVLGSISCSNDIAALEMKFYGTVGIDDIDESHSRQIARQMIQYALGHARTQNSGDSYAQSLMVLEQGISNLRGNSNQDAMGMILLAMSTLHYERGEFQDSIEKLQMVHQLGSASLALKVAAWEALIGLNLESGQDVSSLVLANDCFKLLNNSSGGNASALEVLDSRAKAIKGLTHLILGELKSAEELFVGCKEHLEDCRGQVVSGNIALSHGEFLHATGNLNLGKDLYEKALNELEDVSVESCYASSNMISEEVRLGATCALGQLLSHSGNFIEAEELLTKALTWAESHFGLNHSKVGVILTCIALMYKQKAKLEASSAILIQEGLYRRALDMLKAPALDNQDSVNFGKKDVIALARGGYAEILCVQQNRKGEGERMMRWAEAVWTNRRMSLAEALEVSESPKSSLVVVDTRTCRVL